MSTWRPPQRIRVVAIAVAWRGDQLFVFKVEDEDGRLRGLRPPGGGIEFGESSEDGLRREMDEELGTGIAIEGPPVVLENRFAHNGVRGHEIVFAYPVRFLRPALYERDRTRIWEPHGGSLEALWVDFADFVAGRQLLFPTGLLEVLQRMRKSVL